jgi:HAMP domain-containing protein
MTEVDIALLLGVAVVAFLGVLLLMASIILLRMGHRYG